MGFGGCEDACSPRGIAIYPHLTAEEERFRNEITAFLASALPPDWRMNRLDHDLEEGDEHVRRAWQRTLFEGGWLQLSWPKSAGGRYATPVMEAIFQTELARAGAPPIWGRAGVYLLAPTLMEHGSPSQQALYVPALLTGDLFFCQAFSEPNSGSDLASLQTRAVRNANGWLLNGQKIWSSGAMHADRAFLLAKTDPHGPPHQNIGFFLVDLNQSGVDVRPTRQLNGNAEFAEIFLSDVPVDELDLVGSPGDGWRIAMTTFAFERAAIANAVFLEMAVDEVLRIVQSRDLGTDPVVRQELARLFVDARVFAMQSWRDLARYQRGESRGAETSMSNIAWTEVAQRVRACAVRALGMDGLVLAEGPSGKTAGQWLDLWLWSVAQRIYGGTAEIQRNVVAERLLGLPRGR